MTKSWKHLGEVSKDERPANSLLNADILFDQIRPTISLKKDDETEFRKIIQNRIKDKAFDNHIIEIKKKNTIFEDEDKNEVVNEKDGSEDKSANEEMTKEEMTNLFWDIDGILNQICDFGGSGVFGVDKTIEKGIFDSVEKKTKRSVDKKKKEQKLISRLKKVKNVNVLK